MNWIVNLVILLTIAGCTSAQTISGVNKSLIDLQRVAEKNLPVAKRRVSRNAREFYSEYFVENKGVLEAYEGGSERRYAVIRVLGDRRPYNLEVDVIVEGVSPQGGFAKLGNDERLARVIKRRIQKDLYERRDDRNIIDDFRPF